MKKTRVSKELEESLQRMKGREYQPINQEETNRLVALAKKGDRNAKEVLINSHILMFKPQVTRWRIDQPKITIEELFQIVRYGINDASTKYDESYNAKFRTFCNQHVIKHYYNHIHDLSVIRVKDKHYGKRKPSELVMQSIQQGISLSKSRVDFDSIAKSIVCREQCECEPSQDAINKINEYIEILTFNQRSVICGLFGLFGEPFLSTDELQADLKRNGQWSIHKIKFDAVNKIRKYEESKNAEPCSRHIRPYKMRKLRRAT